MPSASTAQFAAASPMGIYERRHQPLDAGVWGEHFRPDYGSSNAHAAQAMAAMEATEAKFEPAFLQVQEDALVQEALRRQSPDSSDQEPARPGEKTQRRLAQNREAARKSRLRKKVPTMSTNFLLTIGAAGLYPEPGDEPDEAGADGAGAQPGQATGCVRRREQQPCCWSAIILRSRCCGVRDGVRALVGGAGEADGGAAGGAAGAGAGAWRAGCGGPAPRARRDRARALRPAVPCQVGGGQVRRVLHHVGRVEARRGPVLPLDRRVPPLGAPQGPGAAAGAAYGGAGGGGGPAAADGAAGGGCAVAGHGKAAADAHRVPAADDDAGGRRLGGLHRRRRVLRGAADGERDGQAGGARRVRGPGRSSPAADAAEHVQDPDGAAGGAGAPRPRRLLPPAPRAQLALGGAAARAGVSSPRWLVASIASGRSSSCIGVSGLIDQYSSPWRWKERWN